MSIYGKISRRTWLKGMAIFSAAGVSLMLASTAAQAKASKAAVHYQDHPNERYSMCQTCKFFIFDGCQVALRHDGVSPDGRRYDGTWNDGSGKDWTTLKGGGLSGSPPFIKT